LNPGALRALAGMFSTTRRVTLKGGEGSIKNLVQKLCQSARRCNDVEPEGCFAREGIRVGNYSRDSAEPATRVFVAGVSGGFNQN